MDSVTTRTFRRAVMDVATATTGPAFGGKLRTTQSPVVVTKTAVLASFTAAISTFSGYAEVAQTWSASGQLADGVTRSPGVKSKYWVHGGSTFQNVHNVYLTNSGGSALVGAVLLPAPVALGSLDAAFWPLPQLTWEDPPAVSIGGLDLLTTSHTDRLTLDLCTAALGVLDAANVRLFNADFFPTPDSTLADYVAIEADYSGYAAQPVATWLAAYVGGDGRARAEASSLLFQPDATTVGNTIYGVFVTNAADDTLLFSYLLDEPVGLNGPDDGLVVEPALVWGT